jgi:O-antigen/teichoic acid export membrane protein
MASAYPLLAWMALGRWVSMSQVVTRGVITAQAKHRALALSSLVQALVTLGLGLVLIRTWGVLGMAVAIALGDAVCEGLFSLVYGCRLLGMSATRYAVRIAGATVVALAVPCGLLATAVYWRPVSSWLDLIVYGATFSVLSIAAVVWYNEHPRLSSLLRLNRRRAEEVLCTP